MSNHPNINTCDLIGLSFKARNSVKSLQKVMGNNLKLDLVNVDVHTKFGQILSIHSQ